MQQNMSHQCDSSWPWQGTWGDYSSSPGSPHKTLAGRVEHLRLSGVCPYTPEPVDSSWEHVSLLFLCHECNFWTKKRSEIWIKIIFSSTVCLLCISDELQKFITHIIDFPVINHIFVSNGLEALNNKGPSKARVSGRKTLAHTNKQTDQNRKNIYFSSSRYSNKPCTGWVSSAENQTQIKSS